MQGFQLATSVDAAVIAQLKTDLYFPDGRKALVGTAGTVGDKVLLVVAEPFDPYSKGAPEGAPGCVRIPAFSRSS
jgi:hypothetical protein